MSDLSSILRQIEPVPSEWAARAQARLDRLTKPLGSLGKLESLARQMVGIRRSMDLRLDHKIIFTFAADHGVAEEGVSLYPRSVTAQMVKNFLAGGAAVNVLAGVAGAWVCVIDAGVLEPVETTTPPSGGARLVSRRLGPGTKNFLNEPAMTSAEALRSVEWGAAVFTEEYRVRPIDVAGVGDMGIGNSTSAAALYTALLDLPPERLAGRGTGLDDDGLDRKIAVIRESLARRRPDPANPMDVLGKVGGFEIGQMAGCFLAGAAHRVPMIVDGFISSAAALVACRLSPACRDYLFFSHRSAEGGHAAVLQSFEASPILDLGLRLGEGTGAALAMPVLAAAVAMFTRMATFDSAGVDESSPKVSAIG